MCLKIKRFFISFTLEIIFIVRNVAQPGSVPEWGSGLSKFSKAPGVDKSKGIIERTL
jgi:hypothetical protein